MPIGEVGDASGCARTEWEVVFGSIFCSIVILILEVAFFAYSVLVGSDTLFIALGLIVGPVVLAPTILGGIGSILVFVAPPIQWAMYYCLAFWPHKTEQARDRDRYILMGIAIVHLLSGVTALIMAKVL